MKQINMRFLSSVFVLAVFGITGAFAAPSVKMLGTNTARIGSNTSVVKSNTNSGALSQPQQRLGSIRAKTMTSVTPTAITSTTANTGTDTRISLGNASLNKYLHAPVTSAAPQQNPSQAPVRPGVTEQDFTDLADRVQDLEDGIEIKQDTLVAGPGVVLEDNTISLSEDFAQLPSQMDEMQGEIDTKVTQADVNNSLNNYYTKYEVQNILNDMTGSDVKTIYDYATGQRKYVTVVDNFNEAILN